MKTQITLLFLFTTFGSFAQKSIDTKIIVTLNDTIGFYEKIRAALVKADFVVKDDRKADSLIALPYNIKSTTYMFVYAVISGKSVHINGYMGDASNNILGITVMPNRKYLKKIFYYKHDKYWGKLMGVAKDLNGTLSYSR